VFGQHFLYWTLGIGSVVGLATYIGGFLLKSSTMTEPLELVADLLYTFGWALWTGVVVVLFTRVIPEAKRRQFKQALEAYEAAQREEAQSTASQCAECRDLRRRGATLATTGEKLLETFATRLSGTAMPVGARAHA
jgi:hypothetical protein